MRYGKEVVVDERRNEKENWQVTREYRDEWRLTGSSLSDHAFFPLLSTTRQDEDKKNAENFWFIISTILTPSIPWNSALAPMETYLEANLVKTDCRLRAVY